MPRTGVSLDDVAQSIHSLEKAGLNPSIRLIREKLGKGSLTTIAEHKRAYEADRAEGPGEALPDPIARGLIAGAQRHWQELVDAAQAEIDAVRETAAAEQLILETKLADASNELAGLHDKLGAQTAAVADLQAARRDQAAALEAQAGLAQEKDVQIARLTAENGALTDRLTQLKEQNGQIHAALSEAQAEHARLSERLESQAAEFAKDRAALQAQAQADQSQRTALADKVREANDARHLAEKAATDLESRAVQSERECQRLIQVLTENEDQIRSLTGTAGELRGRLAAAEERLANDNQVFERRLDESAAHAATLKSALEDAQRLMRQYAGIDPAKARSSKRKNK